MKRILRKTLLSCFALSFPLLSLAQERIPSSFNAAKKILPSVYSGLDRDYYCNCKYDKNNKIDFSSCPMQARKNKERAARIEWEHVVPAWEVGHQRQCWQNGGRENCNKTDSLFVKMTSDLHNLVPAVGELNADRSNYGYGIVSGEPRLYGQCNFEVDFKGRRVEPPEVVQGDVARIYFYMRDKYGLRISKQQTQLFNAWSKQDPVSPWELERDRRIGQLQGTTNCYVSRGGPC